MMTSASTVPLPMGSTEHVFPARPVMLREIRAFIARLATAAGIPDAEPHRIVLAANDLVPCPGQPEVDPALLALADAARAEPVAT